MHNDPRTTPTIWLAGAAIAVALTANVFPQSAGPRTVDTFTATTANMTPAGLDLRMQILTWQEADARAAVVATLAAEEAADPPLAKLPTVGYVWPAQSPVGYSVKYAQRAPLPNGGERITLVTDKRLGSYDFRGWSVASPAPGGEAPYSVIELDLNDAGGGTGDLSLGAAEIRLDEEAGTVSLADGGAPSLLTNVKRETAGP